MRSLENKMILVKQKKGDKNSLGGVKVLKNRIKTITSAGTYCFSNKASALTG